MTKCLINNLSSRQNICQPCNYAGRWGSPASAESWNFTVVLVTLCLYAICTRLISSHTTPSLLPSISSTSTFSKLSSPPNSSSNHFYFLDLTDLSKNASIRSQLSSKYIQIYGLGDPCSQILDRLVSLPPGGLVLHLVRLRVCHHHNHVGGAVAQNLATARLAEFQVTL